MSDKISETFNEAMINENFDKKEDLLDIQFV